MAEQNQNLQYAEQLLREGRKQEARTVLVEYVRGHASSARGWWMLSFALTDPKQQSECVERVLRLDPNYTPAHARSLKLKADIESETGLDILGQVSPEKQKSFNPSPAVSASPDEEKAASQPVRPAPDISPAKKKANLILPFAFLSICIVLGAVGSIVILMSPLRTAFSFAVRPSQIPVNTILPQTLPPTWTPTTTSTPTPSKTPDPVTPTAEFIYAETEVKLPNFEGWLATGKNAPDFTMEDVISGQQITLSDYQDHPVIIFFFVTWCGFCDGEVPALNKIYQEYGNKGLVVLGVDEKESAAKVHSFRDAYDIQFPVLIDQDGEILRLYKGTRYPTNYFIDSDGKVSTSVRGMMDYASLNIKVRILFNLIPTASPR